MATRKNQGGDAGIQGSLDLNRSNSTARLNIGAPRSRSTAPPSSALAAERLGQLGASKHSAIVLKAIREHPGRTAEGLEEPTGLHKSAIGKRLPELRRAGLIERVGESSRGARFFYLGEK